LAAAFVCAWSPTNKVVKTANIVTHTARQKARQPWPHNAGERSFQPESRGAADVNDLHLYCPSLPISFDN